MNLHPSTTTQLRVFHIRYYFFSHKPTLFYSVLDHMHVLYITSIESFRNFPDL